MNEALDTAIFEILQARRGATAKEIVQALGLCGVPVDKTKVNSRLYTLKTQGVLDCSADKAPVWSKVSSEQSSTTALISATNTVPQDQPGPFAWLPVQEEIIKAPANARLFVEAAPGTGKTAVACARVGHLLQQGHTAGCIHLVSFTRTAVAEIRNRIVAMVGNEAK